MQNTQTLFKGSPTLDQKLPYLIVDHIRMWRRVERIDGLQDVVSQVGQVDEGIGDHSLYVGGARHQEGDGSWLTTRNHWLGGVILLGETREKRWNACSVVTAVNQPADPPNRFKNADHVECCKY